MKLYPGLSSRIAYECFGDANKANFNDIKIIFELMSQSEPVLESMEKRENLNESLKQAHSI